MFSMAPFFRADWNIFQTNGRKRTSRLKNITHTNNRQGCGKGPIAVLGLIYHNWPTYFMLVRMQCTEWLRLLDLYVASTARHSESIAALSHSTVSNEARGFDREWEECELASARSASIKRQMYDHLLY